MFFERAVTYYYNILDISKIDVKYQIVPEIYDTYSILKDTVIIMKNVLNRLEFKTYFDENLPCKCRTA